MVPKLMLVGFGLVCVVLVSSQAAQSRVSKPPATYWAQPALTVTLNPALAPKEYLPIVEYQPTPALTPLPSPRPLVTTTPGLLVTTTPDPAATPTPKDRWRTPFGVESNILLSHGVLLTRTVELNVGWVRLNGRVSWRALQPNQTDPINWSLLAGFEGELRALRQIGATVIVVVDDYPRWATINKPFPTSCGALRADAFDEFAAFAGQLAARYSRPEFDVHHWELGNEPDIDPSLIGPDSVFGCWGDRKDTFYGGRHYGAMLKMVGPAIKAADPAAQVWTGGLLLNSPNSNEPGRGKPELFFKGILEAGAAPYFDVVPYHAHPQFYNDQIDFDLTSGRGWDRLGGFVIGKARYLRQIMEEYGVDKPLFISEGALGCRNDYSWCQPPGDLFWQVQASHAVRAPVRALGIGVQGYIWYSLDGPGWRDTGLMDANGNLRPVFLAYQQLNRQLQHATMLGPVFYGTGVEGYAFVRAREQVHVVWAEDAQTIPIIVPQSAFIAAFDRDGNQLTPALIHSDYQLLVGFEPIYIVRHP